MDYLFSEPHQADKRTQGAGDDEAALQAVRKQVLSANVQKSTYVCEYRKEKKKSFGRLLGYWVHTHVESMSSGSVKRELTEPVNRHL